MNKEKIISLNFKDKTITGLAGFPYGKEIYEEQVKNIFDENTKNVIIFPEQIERVAISFFQGFTKEMIEKYGKDNMLNKIEIRGKNNIVKKFYSVI